MNNLNPNAKCIVGLVGSAGSGKDTVASIFQENGYHHISSSDVLRDEIAKRGLTTSRALQTRIANEMRIKEGPGYWVDLSLQQVPSTGEKVIVSGLYAPGEGTYITEELQGELVGVVIGSEDNLKLRYNRVKSRMNGSRDNLNYEQFLEAHTRENSGSEDFETNIARLIGMSSFLIDNSSDLINLHRQAESIINKLDKG